MDMLSYKSCVVFLKLKAFYQRLLIAIKVKYRTFRESLVRITEAKCSDNYRRAFIGEIWINFPGRFVNIMHNPACT